MPPPPPAATARLLPLGGDAVSHLAAHARRVSWAATVPDQGASITAGSAGSRAPSRPTHMAATAEDRGAGDRRAALPSSPAHMAPRRQAGQYISRREPHRLLWVQLAVEHSCPPSTILHSFSSTDACRLHFSAWQWQTRASQRTRKPTTAPGPPSRVQFMARMATWTRR